MLGRDCIQALDQKQQIQSKDKHQRATKTPLGWAIIGKPAPSTRPLKNTASFKDKATSQILPHSNTVLKTTTTPASTPYSTSNKKPSYAQLQNGNVGQHLQTTVLTLIYLTLKPKPTFNNMPQKKTNSPQSSKVTKKRSYLDTLKTRLCS